MKRAMWRPRRYRWTLAEIVYRLPDHPGLLQSYIWRELDLAPHFPVLHRFLTFWQHNLDGKVHSVQVACAELATPTSFRFADMETTLH